MSTQTPKAWRRCTGTVAMLLSLTCVGVAAQELTITLENDSARERQIRDRIEAFLEQYDLSDWLFTREIRIDENDIPHSHPVLTLHTRHLGDDEMLLAVLLHEQFHWFASESDGYGAAIGEFARMFPDPPDRQNGGASSPRSTALHFVVCDMEFQAMSALLGDETARSILGRGTVYPWIYDQVLSDPRIREVVRKHRLLIP